LAGLLEKMLQQTAAAFFQTPGWCGAISSASVRRMAQTKRIIKKYPNRRLYDTEISSYITLEEVRQLVLDNEDFEVRDAKSGEELTRSVLLQIISEHEDKGQPMLSPQLLSQIIRFYGDSLQGFMGPYLERSLQVFLDQQTQFRSQLNSLMGQTPWNTLNDLTERNMAAFQAIQRGLMDTAAKVIPTPPASTRSGKKSG
jgi:polyhydroxyalkanoate synthesis repressor PhaR